MKAIAAGLLLILTPVLHAQERGTRHPVASYPTASLDMPRDQPDPFRLPPRPPLTFPASQPVRPVSVNELLIPPKAAKELERSQKALRSGDVRASAEHLEKAVQIYPDFLLGHNLLGTRYMKLNEYDKALAEYQKAVAIDPNSAQNYHNVCAALYFLKRYPEAEAAARQALDLDPQHVGSRYLLARTLFAQGRVTQESIELLRQTEDQYPNASLVLALVRFHQGNIDQVVAELRQYLKAPPDADNKQKAECWLAQLTHTPAHAGCTVVTTVPNFQ